MPRKGSKRRAVRTVYRTARRVGRRASRGFGGKSGGIIRDVEGSLGKGILYQGVAQKFIPQLAPIAGLYGEWKGGGLQGLAITELLVKPFLGMPSALGNITGLLGNLTGGGQMQSMGGAV